MNYFLCAGGRATHSATKITVAKTPLATFESNVSGLYIPEILAYIQATQAGSGDPSPSNPRAITGISSVTVTNNDGQTPPVEEYTATINLGGTYYGGYVNVPTGLMTVTNVIDLVGDLEWRSNGSGDTRFFYSTLSNATRNNSLCSSYPLADIGTSTTYTGYTLVSSGGEIICRIRDTTFVSAADFKTGMASTQIYYELATPQTVQLTPAQIEQLLGQNNVFCSSGDVAVKYWKMD